MKKISKSKNPLPLAKKTKQNKKPGGNLRKLYFALKCQYSEAKDTSETGIDWFLRLEDLTSMEYSQSDWITVCWDYDSSSYGGDQGRIDETYGILMDWEPLRSFPILIYYICK